MLFFKPKSHEAAHRRPAAAKLQHVATPGCGECLINELRRTLMCGGEDGFNASALQFYKLVRESGVKRGCGTRLPLVSLRRVQSASRNCETNPSRALLCHARTSLT